MNRTTSGHARRLMVGVLLAALALLLATSVANAAPRKALVNDATVTGGASSQEATIAAAQGFTVDVVDDATWATMTAADFGQYDLLIAGDPTCGSLPPGLVATAPVYGPVVLGHAGGRSLAGNRIVVGTDPVLHDFGDYTSPGARGTIIRDGIAFAGAQPGRTGMYFDTTCAANYSGQSAETLAILAALSEGSGAWTIDADPPCGGAVSLIASHPSFSDLTTASLEGWGCSVHESYPTFPSDWSALAVATDTASHPTCGVDPNTGASACGEAYILLAGSSIVVVSGSISVTPLDATNPTGTDHAVTAHVTSGGAPLAGQVVTFTVTGQNAGAAGTCVPAGCVTNASGDVTFTYHDSNGAGDDTIKASFTDSAGSLQAATAQKHWTGGPPPDPPITDASGKRFTATEGASFSETVASFKDPDSAATASEYSASIDWGDGSATSTGAISKAGDTFSVTGTHTYLEEGPYDVTVVITDVDNASNTATVHSSAVVADAPLTSECATPATSLRAYAGSTARFTDADPNGTSSDYTATIDWGDSSTSAGTVSSGTGSGPYTVSGTHTYGSTGPRTITTTIDDAGGSRTVSTCRVLVFAFAPGGGSFAIGDRNSATGTHVTFWGAQWWKLNSLSGGAAPAAFKGFARYPALPKCGTGWSTDPGNSAPPPNGPLPAYMGVIVTSKVTKSGSQISGNTVHIVVVRTDSGYLPDPGHAGTGRVETQVC